MQAMLKMEVQFGDGNLDRTRKMQVLDAMILVAESSWQRWELLLFLLKTRFPTLQLGAVPWLPQPTPEGQRAAVSPLMQAPFQRELPSDPDHSLQETSVKVPNKAPCPDGKNALAPPVSSQISKWKGAENELVSSAVVWPQNCWLPETGHMSVTFTTMLWNGPVYDGEYGSSVPVSAKHRPHASPGPRPGSDPKESWLMAAV